MLCTYFTGHGTWLSQHPRGIELPVVGATLEVTGSNILLIRSVIQYVTPTIIILLLTSIKSN